MPTPLRLLLGLVFFASGILKLFPIEAFELVLLNQTGLSWGVVPIASRLLICLELLLGSALVFGLWPKKALWTSLALLSFFSVYLASEILSGTAAENCGCFGELIPMDGPQSLAKNAVLIALVVLLLLLPAEKLARFSWKPGALLLAMAGIAFVFIVQPPDLGNLGEKAEMDIGLVRSIGFEENFDKGNQAVLFLYANCVHCKRIASLIGSQPPVAVQQHLFLAIYGSELKVGEFLKETNTGGLHHRRTTDRVLMGSFDGIFPTLVQVSNGKTGQMWQGDDINLAIVKNVCSSTAAPAGLVSLSVAN